MDRKLFAALMNSVKQAGSIARGETPASRTFVAGEQNVKAIRENLRLHAPGPNR